MMLGNYGAMCLTLAPPKMARLSEQTFNRVKRTQDWSKIAGVARSLSYQFTPKESSQIPGVSSACSLHYIRQFTASKLVAKAMFTYCITINPFLFPGRFASDQNAAREFGEMRRKER